MLNPIEEAKHAKLREMCRELRVPPPPEIMIGLQVHENGVLTFDDVQRGHSWTRNFWNQTLLRTVVDQTNMASLLTNSGFGAGYMSVKMYNGAYLYLASSIFYPPFYHRSGGSGSPTISGIVPGTSDTAFSLSDYVLGAAIDSGTSAGRFSYQNNSAVSIAYTAETKTWKLTMSRIFNNNSGGSITVKETGLYGNITLVERSVLSPAVAVANGAQLTVTYEISMDFSAIDT